MFNVIRIPTKFSRPIKRLSDKEKLKLLDALINVWDWIIVQQTDDTVWDLLSLIYWEWMNMESKNWYKKDTVYVVNSTPGNPPAIPDCRVEYSRVEENIIEDTTIVVWEQALVVFWKEWVNEVIKTIKESVEDMWWVYKSSTRERQYANHIAEKHKDWWQFLEKRKDWKSNLESVKEIIYFSLNPNNSYVKQIINAEDFWNKWADVIMAMRKEHIEKRKEHIEKTKYNPTGNPLLNF